MKKRRILGIILFIVAIIIFLFIAFNIANKLTFGKGYNLADGLRLLGGKFQSLGNLHKANWVGHEFEVAYLDTLQYKTTGNKEIKFSDNGWYAPSYSMPRSKLLDVNLNQKIKVKIKANFEGELKSQDPSCTGFCMTTERYHFSEFSIYMADESDNKQSMKGFSTRGNIILGNIRNEYKFSELIVENTGEEIIITDNTGFKLSYSKDFNYVTTEAGKELNKGGDYGKLNSNQKWMLVINCHVNGEGYCKLEIKEIVVEKL